MSGGTCPLALSYLIFYVKGPGPPDIDLYIDIIANYPSTSCWLCQCSMALFKYFKHEAKVEKGIHLPVENGPLSEVLAPIMIKEANQAVADMTVYDQASRKA